MRDPKNMNLSLIKARARMASRDAIICYRVFITDDYDKQGRCRLHFDWMESAIREVAGEIGIDLPEEFGNTHPENAYAVAQKLDEVVDACTAVKAVRIAEGKVSVRQQYLDDLVQAGTEVLGFVSAVDRSAGSKAS